MSHSFASGRVSQTGDGPANGCAKIFLSYSHMDASWKKNFIFQDWFSDILGNCELVDYKQGGVSGLGNLRSLIEETLTPASAVIVFLSKDYVQGDYTMHEWRLALARKRDAGQLLVVVVLDRAAKDWWRLQAKQGVVDPDYKFEDFTGPHGGPQDIIGPLGLGVDKVTAQIKRIALALREAIHDNERHENPPPRPEAGPVVILGHPTAQRTPAIEEAVKALTNSLAGIRRCRRWPDGWRLSGLSEKDLDALPSDATFLQPAAPGEAEDWAGTAERQRDRLRQALGLEGAGAKPFDNRYLLWLPDGQRDPEFLARLAAQTEESKAVAELTNASPKALAAALAPGNQPIHVPMLTLEEILDDQNRDLRESLYESFIDVVSEVVIPRPFQVTFHGRILRDQIVSLDADRMIIAIHDLNVRPGPSPASARAEMEKKLSSIDEMVQDVRAQAGRPPMKLFFSALLVGTAPAYPFVQYPRPSRFPDWHLLPFEGSEDSLSQVHPKPDYALAFRSCLRDWAREAAAHG